MPSWSWDISNLKICMHWSYCKFGNSCVQFFVRIANKREFRYCDFRKNCTHTYKLKILEWEFILLLYSLSLIIRIIGRLAIILNLQFTHLALTCKVIITSINRNVCYCFTQINTKQYGIVTHYNYHDLNVDAILYSFQVDFFY